MAFIKKNNPQEEARLDAKDAGKALPRKTAGFGSAPVRIQAAAPSMNGNPNSPMAGGGSFGRFVSLGEYLGQNQPQAQGMANRVAGNAEAAAKDAQGQTQKLETTFNRGLQSADKSIYGNYAKSTPGESLEKANPAGYEAASKAAQSASSLNSGLGTPGTLQDAVRGTYSAQGQSAGEGLWDTGLAQQAGGGRFAQLAARYGDLGAALTAANDRSAAAYGALQRRNQAWDVEDERKRKEAESLAQIEEMNRLGSQSAGGRAITAAQKAAEYRQGDEQSGAGSSRESGGRTKGMTREEWANRHGMTLEQWIANGEKPAF